MGLSYDLISEFVKITNDKKESTKEGTVYATVVGGTEGKYVQIDGSDLLTPMDTTTDIEDGERVTLMIKDHKAIVTGNVTTPSASTSKVDKVTESINSVSDRVGTFELVVADKVSTKELEAYKATIEVLVASKATIEDLTATNAKIENLEVKNAEIENLVAEKATITDLEAVNATIENLKAKDAEIEHAVIENLEATTADIKILNADFAQIKTLVNGNLTSDNILSFNLTSEKVTVDDAFIKDAMIDTISAGKINAGEINTNLVSIGSEDGGMLITGSTQQFTDKNGNVRIQIGKDASGDFTFILYGEDGQGQIINQNGITASAISDGLIVNDMVSDHAAISGGKLDISSVISEINSDNSTTIKSSKIYLNDQAQSLEVAFNSLKTQVDTIQEVTIKGDLTAIVEQVQSNTSKIEANKNSINTLISEDTVIKKQVTDLQGTLSETETTLNSKYTSLSQNLNGFKTTVADTYATKKSVTDVIDNIESNYSTTSVMNSAIEQKAQEISASVSSTYATKNQVNTLDNNLKTNYSTTQQMESAINIAKEEINLGVSSIYETKENIETKVTSTLNSAKSYADTKKSEAISTAASDATSKANKAKKDAITSANNNTSNVIKNYYTKDQTDSQINVAKEAIELGVSTNYETKENIETKVTSTLNSAKSYADTKKSEAISTAASDATSKANTAKQEAITSANNNTSNVIKNYYTKAQTDSQINIAKEAIELGVSTTYETKENSTSKIQNAVNNIQVGGTNLWVLLDLKTGYEQNGNIKESTASHKTRQTLIPTNGSRQLVYQCWNPNKVANSSNTNRVAFFDSSKAYISSRQVLALDGKTYQWQIINIPDNTAYIRLGAICGPSGSYNDTIKIKFELGNKPTDYSLAPEDVKDDISTAKSEAIASASNTLTTTISNYYTKAQTDSQINIAKEAIELGVSTDYETKSNVETKVTSTLNSAKSYADTKKSEAISTAASDATTKANNAKSQAISTAASDATKKANTAKSDAIKSANNTLTSTIANYYTKEQTDSQINIAKEAIELGVSTDYETKANVETKYNNATSIAKAMNSGKILHEDIAFRKGSNNVNTYNNAGNGNVKVERITKPSDCPTTSTHCIRITTTGSASPGWGGFYQSINSRANAVFIQKFVAKLPSGYQLNLASNAMGDAYKDKWLTSNKGTGKWETYIRQVTCGSSGNFSGGGHVYISGGKTPTTSAPLVWYVASCTSIDITDTDERVNSLKTRMSTAESKITDNAITTTVKKNFYTKAQTDSQINIAKEAIELGISTNYETKSNVETKVTSTLNSAKSYADTKKSEAISTAASDATSKANKAKKDAITSANNNTSNVIKNYYTKDQTDSQINVAKNAITQSVSSTYATKTDVTSSINGVNSSISNLQNRMNSAESKITDTAITNTVKKSFYTKTETENAITSKGYATQSQVQQTANDITFKFSQSGGYNLIRNGNPKPHNYQHWWISGNANWFLGSSDIGIQTTDPNEAYAGCAIFKVQPNCDYSFSCWVLAEGNTKGADIYFLGSSKDDGAYEEIHQLFTGGKNGWTKVEATFTTGSNTQYGFIRIDNNGALNTSGYNVVFFSEVQLTKGANYYPQWSPNPNEVYDGVTTIDKDGIKVSSSNINGYTHMTDWGFFVNKGGKDVVSIDDRGLQLFDAKIQLTHANGNRYFLLDEKGIIMYNPDNGTHQWGKVAAINSKFTIASNGNSSGLSLGHHVNENYIEDILCDSHGVVTVQRQINHNGIFYNNYGQMFIRQSGQGGWEITGRSDSQSIKPGGANQGGIGSNTQYINQSWIANRYNPSSIEVKHVSHYVEDNECISLVNRVKPARYFYKEYDDEGNDITTFSSRSSQLGLIYEDVRECSARDLMTNEEDKGINLYGMTSVLWGATRNVNTRLNDAEYEIVLLKEEIEQLKNKLGEK